MRPTPSPCATTAQSSRRNFVVKQALSALLLATPSLPLPAAAARISAQSVGVDGDKGALGIALPDPRSLDQPLVWGGRDRCDPTAPTCRTQGLGGDPSGAVQPTPTFAADKDLVQTDKVSIQISIDGEPAGELALGLWRAAAPSSVDTFVRLSRGTLRNDADDQPASLDRSVAMRVLRDKAVVLGGLKNTGGRTELVPGKTRPQRVPVTPPLNKDSNDLSHSAAGLLSVRRGGGSFEFTLTPRANPALDKEQIVIGQVLDQGSMELLERINNLPTDNYRQAPLVTVKVGAVQVA
jgi:cyclophilin family peptidyl-prolyl cis-trans isomerase